MSWTDYYIYALLTSIFWILGIFLLLIPRNKKGHYLADILIILGVITIVYFTICLWINLERPPFRTLAETRLWYSIFLSVIGIVIYYRWRLNWMLTYCVLLAMLFLFINYRNPDTFDKTLMPALQSPWFIPHVIVYMIAYAFFGVSMIIGINGLDKSINHGRIGKIIRLVINRTFPFFDKKTASLFIKEESSVSSIIKLADNIIYLGFAFLTFGLLFGALLAKEAWGHYWTWDPKETWAFITWMVYLLYIHFRVSKRHNTTTSFWIMSLSFVILIICWFGINILPSAQSSVHVY